ncbi:MAG: zf-HC2 domain-containing protein [Gammaproteobacteria bacterium]
MTDKHRTGSSESQCYFVQLQIDSYLDGDMSGSQRQEFMSHVQACAGCSQEIRFAQTLQDTIMDLPLVDCDESVMEPIHRLGREQAAVKQGGQRPVWLDWFGAQPALLRFALPSLLVAALVLVIYSNLPNPATAPVPQVAAQQQPQYDPAEVVQALQDLNIAIDYLSEVSERTEAMVGSRFLMAPLRDSLNASFDNIRDARNEPLLDDPI